MATTTPNYGWPVPTSTDYVKDGATAIEALGDAIDATVFSQSPGIVLLNTTTIGSAVSSVTVSSVFSATYDRYKIMVVNADASGDDANIFLKFNNSTGSTYTYNGISASYVDGAGGADRSSGTISNGILCGKTGSNNNLNTSIEVFNPFAAAYTSSYAMFSGNLQYGYMVGADRNAASQTGFSLTWASGTVTGGKIYTYGFKS
jgi:hypothetical protein